MDTLNNVLTTLSLTQKDNTFIGQPHDLGWGRIYGGQLIAQSLDAATFSSPNNFTPHSIHCHFLATGSVDAPINYTVETLRNGRTYLSRRVEAVQKNQLIFHALISLQIPEEGLSYQQKMPKVPPPQNLPSYKSTLQGMVDKMSKAQRSSLPSGLKKFLNIKSAFEIRPIRPNNYFIPDEKQPERILWLKASEHLPYSQQVHRSLLAWISDFPILGTALQPSSIPPSSPKIKMTSLDHSMWFYENIDLNNWILFHMTSPKTGCGRGFTHGCFYTQKGQLIATVAQEGMLRLRS